MTDSKRAMDTAMEVRVWEIGCGVYRTSLAMEESVAGSLFGLRCREVCIVE